MPERLAVSGHRKVTCCHTKVKVSKVEGAPKAPLCPKYDAIPVGCHVESVGQRERERGGGEEGGSKK